MDDCETWPLIAFYTPGDTYNLRQNWTADHKFQKLSFTIDYIDGDWVARCTKPAFKYLSGCADSPDSALLVLLECINGL